MSAGDSITIVTGLPRSGTSMMMQMLVAGGIPALSDGERTADEDNPRGYLEYAKTKSLRSDSSWISGAKGKVVKIIAQLLEFLPEDNYRLIFMQRDLTEVVDSQRTMLDRAGKHGARLSDEQLANVFVKQLHAVDGLLAARQIPVFRVSHRACIENPAAVAAEVNRFFGGFLDERAMAASVDHSLYRQRNSSFTP